MTTHFAKLLRTLIITLAVQGGAAFGQTITVTPNANVSVTAGGTLQFSAKVTGLTNTKVNWYVANVLGGNAASGKISTAGLYTAPATIPSANPVSVKAVSQSKSSLSATASVKIVPAVAQLTAVTPNPLPIGSITVTLKGTGFQTGASVTDTYGGVGHGLTVTSLTNTKIVATGTQGTASSASFTVTNAGVGPSNAISVPIKSYALTVKSGTGGGSYPPGTVVKIAANAPPSGKVFSQWTGATVSNPASANTTLTMPAAATTVTATYVAASKYRLTVVNGTGSGSYAAGTTVSITANPPTSGQTFSDWTGATVNSPTNSTTSLSMPAAATTVTANYSGAGSIPFPVTTHPRIWITQADLPRLQRWATSSNPVYQQGMAPLLAQAVNIYETQFFPGGQPNSNYPDQGDTQGYTGQLTEEVGLILAFNSLIDPVPANRIKYAQYARNLIMYALNQTAQGFAANVPFRDPQFLIYNRGDAVGHQWPLIVDWIYNATDTNNQPILTASDKATIRTAFMLWAGSCLTAETTGGDHPEPIGVVNDLSLIGGAGSLAPYRMASNNYYIGHERNLAMLALSLDPSDDPPVDSTKSVALIGNSLRSYILDATGAWLYQTYAMMGDPQQVATDLGLGGTGSGFGLASGGLPPEGQMYGESFATLLGGLLALHTSGFENPSLSGPQIKLAQSAIWDRFVTGYISSLTPTAVVNPTVSYLGPLYYFATFGDLLETYVTPDCMQPFALLALLEQEQGLTTHLNECRWFATNAVQGTLQYNVSTPWTWGCQQAVLYYMLLDPAASAPTDPRPTYPLNFFDASAGRVLAHSDWSSNPTWFTYRASWESINHQHGDAGSFGLWRNGEWLTSEMSNYDNNLVGFTPYYLNSLCLQNWCSNGTPSLSWDEPGIWQNGGQWMWAENAGDPTTLNSYGKGYNYVATDMTGLYNRPNQWTAGDNAADITQATRSVLWLNQDYVVIYDRATSVHSGLFKTFNLCFVNPPTTVGNVTTETMPSGQNLFLQTLLPKNAQVASRLASNDLNPVAELETMQYVTTVQDPSKPTDTRFLHVLQGADSNGTMATATYLASASGTAFDGAVFSNTAVFFLKNATDAVGTTTFTVPASVKSFWIAGLTPNASYTITSQSTGNGKTVTLTVGGSGGKSDGGGLLNSAV